MMKQAEQEAERIKRLEVQLDEVSDMVSPGEEDEISAAKVNTRDPFKYGHDLGQLVVKGWGRKQRYSINQAAKWTARIVSGVAKVDDEKVFYHLLCAVIRWGIQDKHLDREFVINKLRLVADVEVKNQERQRRHDADSNL